MNKINYARKHNQNMFCNNSCAVKYNAKQRRDNFIMPVEKPCNECGKIKLLDQFSPDRRSLDGKVGKCMPCRKRQVHGLTPEDEAKMLQEQNNVCAICGCNLPLCIDHNHITGIIRGLLCNKCNLGIGYFNDNPIDLRKAADYLESFNADNN
ncbi:MAG: endonuclease VII domain-containing protein [Candidatus Anammoxibacter sp.]